ncbi:DegT/DnrJ/EryC1/StrS family aminotransferase [Bdellovibrio reynosensis]|uniref:DegT/DnrJ/EryC1/StrS family aminotransferase n=1 Tax=Bdellovibrio reynosensis TaxID=2835041 RepID=A0ABY4CCJ4_9BACT|nr:DegT/DnrJ/EryC1/StrS family aminotransferase [Bdellovibrio reynosensis]UOF01243.1 DegT/DnrJ/EryC1/StrS family aminotransferase [Bdellovibrio reynosensis]
MSIPFIDLKAQYKALKTSIDSRIHQVLEHGVYVNGPEVVELEKALAAYVGTKHCLTIANGTDALWVPLMALGIGQGDEVITTAFSFIATAEVIVLAGAKPVYVDIDPKTFNIDVNKIEAAITPKTKAIMPVSLYGQMADMDKINAIAKKHNLHVIEDAAQSFGAKYNNNRSGSMSIATGTSFFPAKPLGCYGDGGAIFTNDDNLVKVIKEIREHGSESRYYHTRLGINGRLDTIQCAILLAKMDRYDWELDQRQRVADRYNDAFSSIKADGFSTPFVATNCNSAWAQYTLTVKDRAAFQKKMTDAGVPTSIHYPRIMPDQPWYKTHTADPNQELPVARWAAEHVISLPIYPDMDDATQDKVIAAVKGAF